MYVLTQNFLFDHFSATSLKFIKSEELDCYYDLNNHQYVVEYIDGTTYEQLETFYIISRNNAIIEDGTYFLKNLPVVINGLSYFIDNDYQFLEIKLFKDLLNNFISLERNKIKICLNPSNVENFNIEDFLSFVNNSPEIFIKVIDSELFSLSNISEVDVLIKNENIKTSSLYFYEYKSCAINEGLIVDCFINSLREKFKKYNFFVHLSDLFGVVERSIEDKRLGIRKDAQKLNLIHVNASLMKQFNDRFSLRVQEHPNYGRFLRGLIEVEFEYIGDDFQSFLYLRDLMNLGKEFVIFNSFIYTDELGNDWSYGVDWNFDDMSYDIDRSPKVKYFTKTQLYSLKFKANVIGYIVERISNDAVIIKYPISRIYSGSKLLEAIFDNTDPNVYASASIDLGDGNFLIVQYGEENKVINMKFWNSDLPPIKNEYSETMPMYDLTVEDGEQVYVTIPPLNYVINPVDSPQGTLIANPNTKQIYVSENTTPVTVIEDAKKIKKVLISYKTLSSLIGQDIWKKIKTNNK